MNTLIIDGVEHEINDDVANLVLLISKERDDLKKSLKAQTEPVAEVPCGGVLSDVLELLEKDLKINQQLAAKYKTKTDKEMTRQFQLKRRHIRDLIEQVKALGR